MIKNQPEAEVGANGKQVGGDHYRTQFQHWDFVESIGMGYLEGCATKYLDRYKSKNGDLDLEKAGHYVEKVLELAKQGRPNPIARNQTPFHLVNTALGRFLMSRERTRLEGRTLKAITLWQGTDDLEEVMDCIESLRWQYAAEQEGGVVPTNDAEDFENIRARQVIENGEVPPEKGKDVISDEGRDDMVGEEPGPGYIDQG